MAASPGIYVALQTLHYTAPVAVLAYFIIAKIIAACFLQQPSKQSGRIARKYSAVGCLCAIIASFVAQSATLLVQSTRQSARSASQDAIIYLLVSIIVYGCLTLGLTENKTPLWHPYLGACLTGFALEVPCTAILALTEPLTDDYAILRLALHIARASLLLLFSVSGAFFALQDRSRNLTNGSDTEPLLAKNVNNPDGQFEGSVSRTGYDAIKRDDETHDDEADSIGDSDVSSFSEEPEKDKELKALRLKRLRESGSWLNYLNDFKIFIPILWPSGNRRVQACLAVVCLVVIAERFLNVLIPRQLGRITDDLTTAAGTGNIPWQSVGLWMLYSWLGSSAGLELLRSLATMPIQQFTYKSIGSAAFGHVMRLSMDYHNNKSSGELIRDIEQGQNLQGLLEFICFDIGPTLADLLVALVYVYTLFDVYMSIVLLGVGLLYIWIGAKTTTWSVKQRRRLNTAWRLESKVKNEAIHNWQTVSHFNRDDYECKRFDNTLDQYNAAESGYYSAYYIGAGVQTSVMMLGRLAAALLAAYRIAQGTAPVGNFVTLIFYWSSIERPLSKVSYSIRQLSQMLTDSERLLQLLKTQPTIVDSSDAVDIEMKSGQVEFQDVDFAYDARRPTLQGVSFVARPGQTVALVGETGGGKSTLLKLLYRYYDVAGGAIRIDGQDIRGVTLNSLRDSFGMVPQVSHSTK